MLSLEPSEVSDTRRIFTKMKPEIELQRRVRQPSVHSLVSEAARIYGVMPAQIMGKSRKARVSRARHWVCYYAVMARRLSLERVGDRLGGMDHTSVLYGAAAHSVRHRLPRPPGHFPPKAAQVRYEGLEPCVEVLW